MSPKETVKSPSALSEPAAYSKVTVTGSDAFFTNEWFEILATPLFVSASLPTLTLTDIPLQAFWTKASVVPSLAVQTLVEFAPVTLA